MRRIPPAGGQARHRPSSHVAAFALVPAVVLALVAAVVLSGCGSAQPQSGQPSATGSAGGMTDPPPDRQLAALAAAAEDRNFVASYTLSVNGRPDRTVTVTLAVDGSWRVDVPDGALGGTADVSVARNGAGLFQCATRPDGLTTTGSAGPTSAIGPDGRTGGTRPGGLTGEPACVRVGDPGGSLPSGADPRLEHLFTDWPGVLTDRSAPLAVSVARPLPGARGACFAIESTSASLRPPLDVGIYCYDTDGTLTAARLAAGSLLLVGTPAAAPPTIRLPGPVVPGEPVSMASQN